MKSYSGIYLHDELSGITHTTYDAIRTDCGICWSMYRTSEYRFVELARCTISTCVACVSLRALYPLVRE